MMMIILGLKVWIEICIVVGILAVVLYLVVSLWLRSRQKWRQSSSVMVEKLPLEMGPPAAYRLDMCTFRQVGAMESIGVKEEEAGGIRAHNLDKADREYKGRWSVKSKQAAQAERVRQKIANGGFVGLANGEAFERNKDDNNRGSASLADPSVFSVPHNSEMSWGRSYTQQELDEATHSFSDANVLGQGSQGLVYRGQLPGGTHIVLKKLSSINIGKAEKDFKVEVEAVGRVRHKNLVRLIGYCVDGSQRVLVYEYINNGNLKEWLHGPLQGLPWDVRLKIIIGTAKGLAYLHEGLEPKVIHRDIKSSNILLDSDWNAKVSDFGFAKLLRQGHSHVTTRVMGTFGYVAPEYASTGMLTEKSDVFSYGVLVMELITGRVPVDYSRPAGEVNLVEWVKAMVGCRRAEEVVDPKMVPRPSSRSLKGALLVALRCVDPDAPRRPKMGHVVHMLEEADSYSLGENGEGPLPRRNGDLNTTTSIQKEHYSTKLLFGLAAQKCNSNHAQKTGKNAGDQSKEKVHGNGNGNVFVGIVDPKGTWKYER